MNTILTQAEQALQQAFKGQETNVKHVKEQLQTVRKALNSHHGTLCAQEVSLLDSILSVKTKCAQLKTTQEKKLTPLFLAILTQQTLKLLPTVVQPGHMAFKFENSEEKVEVPQATIERLRLHSNYFKAEFSTFTDRQEMRFPDVTKAAFEKIIDYVFTGNFPALTEEDIAEFISAAEFFQIPALISFCREQLKRLLASYDYDDLLPYVAKECLGQPEQIPGFHRAAFQALVECECRRMFNNRSQMSTALTSWLNEQNCTLAHFLDQADRQFPEAARYFRCLHDEDHLDPISSSETPSLLDGLCFRLKHIAELPANYLAHFSSIFNSEPNTGAFFFLWHTIGTENRIKTVFIKNTDAQLIIDWLYDPERLTQGNYDGESLRCYPCVTQTLVDNLEKEARWEAVITLTNSLLGDETPADLRMIYEAKRIHAQVQMGQQPTKLTDFPIDTIFIQLVPTYFRALFLAKDYARILHDLRSLEGRGLDDILQPFREQFAVENLEIWADDILPETITKTTEHTLILLELCNSGIVNSPPRNFAYSATAEDSFALSCAGFIKQQEGDYAAAITLYTKALVQGAPDGIRLHRAGCYLALDKQNEALLDVQQATRLSRNPIPLLMLETKLQMETASIITLLQDVPQPFQSIWCAKFLQPENTQTGIDSLSRLSDDSRAAACLCHLYMQQNEPAKAFALIQNSPPSANMVSAANLLFAKMPLHTFSKNDCEQQLKAATDFGHNGLQAYLTAALHACDSYNPPQAHLLKGEPGFWLLLNFWRTLPWQENPFGTQEDKQALLERLQGELNPEIRAVVPYIMAFVERNPEAARQEFEKHREYLGTTPYRAFVADKEEAKQILGDSPFVPLVAQELLGIKTNDPSRLEEHWQNSKYSAILEHLQNSSYVDRKAVKISLADKYMHQNRWNSAFLLIKEVLTDHPDDQDAKGIYWRCLHHFEQYEEAMKFFVPSNKFDLPLGWKQAETFGHCCQQLGQLEPMQSDLKKALVQNKDWPVCVANTLLDFYPNPVNFTYKHFNPFLVGQWLVSQKRFEEAADRFTVATKNKSDRKFAKRAEFYAAQCYAQIGLHKEANTMIYQFMRDKAVTLEEVGQEFLDQAEKWASEFNAPKKRRRPAPTKASLRKTKTAKG